MTDITLNNNGTKLAASVDGTADAPPILFLHGISLSRDTWNEIALRLANRHQVWTLDFRGHGHSDRTENYDLTGYVSDAKTALAAIGRPTIVVGHSLGGCVAGVLAQSGHDHVRAAVLEDPPWYLGEAGQWEQSVFPRVFSIVSARQAAMQQEKAPLAAYLDFVANAPSPMGGLTRDHFGPRHLLSHASALQRQDVRCWGNVVNSASALAAIATDQPFRCPVKIIQADPRYGAALLEGHEKRLADTNPQVDIVRYIDSGHRPHAALAFEQRFVADLESFISKVIAR